MMLKLLSLTALVLGLSSGVALADRDGRGHHGGRGHHDGGHRAVYRHRDASYGHGHDGRGDRHRHIVRDRGWHGGGRVIVDRSHHHRIVRRPIFVARPIIRERYYNYYRRPALIVENYGAMPGYYWVAGHWSWSGYEWIWQPGHYEPDPNYVDPVY